MSRQITKFYPHYLVYQKKTIRRDFYALRDMNLIHYVGSIRQSIEKLQIKRNLTAQVLPKFRPSSTTKDDTINVQVNITKLTDRQRKIYKATKNDTINDTINGTINAQMLSEAIDASIRTIKRELYSLRDMNLIKYIGSNKTGHWEIADKKL